MNKRESERVEECVSHGWRNLCDERFAYKCSYTFTYTYDTELEQGCRYIFGRLHLLEQIL